LFAAESRPDANRALIQSSVTVAVSGLDEICARLCRVLGFSKKWAGGVFGSDPGGKDKCGSFDSVTVRLRTVTHAQDDIFVLARTII
jgi:hypothetical protein